MSDLKKRIEIEYDVVAEAIVCLMSAQRNAQEEYARTGLRRWFAEAERLRASVECFHHALRNAPRSSYPPRGTF